MILSTNLLSIPFVSSTDSTRLQMSSKQISQSLTHTNCQVAKVIGNNWRYLTETSKLYRYQAPSDGKIIYTNDDIMIIILDIDGEQIVQVLDTPYVKQTTGYYSVTLRYRADSSDFKAGDILYEYDSFHYNLPTYGYMLNVVFMPWFGFNHEDSIVISESVANRCRSTKMEKFEISIYDNSLFKMEYDNKYKIIPEINQPINGSVLTKAIKLNNQNYTNIKEYTRIRDNKKNIFFNVNIEQIVSKIPNGIVTDVRIFKTSRDVSNTYDPELNKCIRAIQQDYYKRIQNIGKNIEQLLGTIAAKEIIKNHYLIADRNKHLNSKYLIEVTVTGENKTELGDKFANRYANKGVVNLILPDELMPITESGKRADIIINPISVYSRMNFGQLIEGIVSKTIVWCEEEILKNQSDANKVSEIVQYLSGLAKIFKCDDYAEKILQLSEDIKTDVFVYNRFINSIKAVGLYFETPNFVDFNMIDLINYLKLPVYENIIIKKETLMYMKDKLGVDIDNINEDLLLKDMFFCPNYFMKLKHESSAKITARDFGEYKRISKQPIQGHHIGGGSSKLGNMELDGLIASGLINCINEFRTVKSDNRKMKDDLVSQIFTNGEYRMSCDLKSNNESYSKKIINGILKTLNS